ncbi:hypothetical protein [Haloferax sp. Atlit-12N]|uniref:hypothetical protein n=1 Tax=Haloferax sp. Atlit-12N TaxID=2077203 RepID=UPI0011E5C41D|nr:hypothetical protein [Haloferax sp. Atlit-12N]
MGQLGKQVKYVLIFFSVSITYFLWAQNTHYFRAITDEQFVAYDIYYISQYPHLLDPIYQSGLAFQMESGITMRILGTSYGFWELWTPIYGVFTLSFIAIAFLSIYRRTSDGPSWGFLLPSVGVFVFPVFIKRMMETTHKAHSYILIFLLFISIFEYLQTDDRRFVIIGACACVGIALTNYVWGAIWSGFFITSLLSHQNIRQFSQYDVTASIAVGISAYLSPAYLPGTGFHERYITQKARQLFISEQQTAAAPSGKATSLISGWPTIDVLGIEFSVWFIYSFGTLFVATLTAIAGLFALREWYMTDHSPTERFTIVIFGYVSLVCLLLLAAGDLATFKRLIVIPGVFGLFYIAYRQPNLLQQIPIQSSIGWKNLTLVCILIILVISSGFAVKRTVLDGTGQPYDHYAEKNQVDKIQWMGEYNTDCIQIHNKVDKVLASKLIFEKQGYIEYNPSADTIYHSGDNGYLTCSKLDWAWW